MDSSCKADLLLANNRCLLWFQRFHRDALRLERSGWIGNLIVSPEYRDLSNRELMDIYLENETLLKAA